MMSLESRNEVDRPSGSGNAERATDSESFIDEDGNLPLVCSVVVNYKAPDDTIRCLASLWEQTYPNHELVVVDNDGDITGANRIRQAAPDATIIHTGENLGFSSGFNVGIQHALLKGADFISIINNDMIVREDFVGNAFRAMRQSPDIGLVGGKIFHYDERKTDIIWAAGGGFSWLRGKGVADGFGERNGPEWERPRDVEFIPGAQMFVRREVFDAVGLLPEVYFLGGEEWDFCHQIGKAEFRIRFVPDVVGWHEVSHTAEESYARYYNLFRNKLVFTRRQYSTAGWVLWLVVFITISHSHLLLKHQDNWRTVYAAAISALWRTAVDGARGVSRAEYEWARRHGTTP